MNEVITSVGIDAHKRNHTAGVFDGQGRQLATRTTGSTAADHLALLRWARRYGSERLWAVEDCRHLEDPRPGKRS